MASHTLRCMTALGFGIPMLFAGIAFAQCGAPNTSDCCAPSQFPGCSDATCCTKVCTLDPFCCDIGWDILCVNKANHLCESCRGATTCGAPSANDCCAPSTTPGCNDAECCETICTFDFSCCDTAWDANCAQKAIKFCQICIGWGGGGCGETSPNDCCSTSVFPGCSDEVCCEAVCAVDPFCCIDAWSQTCAAQALQLCTTCDDICGAPNANDCCAPSQTLGCSDGACCETVCAVDPSCCIFGWDLDCVNTANDLCKSCGGGGGGSVCGDPNAGNCCVLSQFAGCSDAVCCEKVCAVDPSCCDQYWDMDCVNAAKTMCEACGASPCTGDVTGDGAVDGSDLAAVLVAWGSNGQGELDTDLNDDGIVDGSDLTFVLVGWGPCP